MLVLSNTHKWNFLYVFGKLRYIKSNCRTCQNLLHMCGNYDITVSAVLYLSSKVSFVVKMWNRKRLFFSSWVGYVTCTVASIIMSDFVIFLSIKWNHFISRVSNIHCFEKFEEKNDAVLTFNSNYNQEQFYIAV